MQERIFRVLGVKPGDQVVQMGQAHPESLAPIALAEPTEGAQYERIFVYVHSLEEMRSRLEEIQTANWLKPSGYIYLLYPKLKNPLKLAGIHRDHIFPHLGVNDQGQVSGLPYKFNRMISASEVYTLVGLKEFVSAERRRDRDSISALVQRNEQVKALRQSITKQIKAKKQEILEQLAPALENLCDNKEALGKALKNKP